MAKKLAADKLLFTAVVLLLGFGLVMVYSASAAIARDRSLLSNPFLVKQAVAAGVGLALMIGLMHLDYRRLCSPLVVYPLLAVSFALLVGVLFSPQLNGTRRWYFLAGLSVQPSELAKLALIPFLAYQIDKKQGQVNRVTLLLPIVLFTLLTSGLILLEPDLGTAVLLVATALLLVFLAGLTWHWMVGALVLLPPLLWLLVMAEPYRRERLFSFLDPERDPLGGGFQALQSLIAVGSGGVFGLGPGKGVQKLYFLPHPESDFIFSIVAEELGMLGALALITAFAVFAWRGLRAGAKAPDLFGRYLGWGFTGLVALQALINVSVTVALLPTKGIPLPFISYGGSSLVVTLCACGVVLNVSQHG
ncbi:MAG TPA: putative lipid II flippase FtsW [Thermoanaerobaculia bacterium]|nr:putative lipid II flippase FtsW [Thermoanaerobaculia bacterium]